MRITRKNLWCASTPHFSESSRLNQDILMDDSFPHRQTEILDMLFIAPPGTSLGLKYSHHSRTPAASGSGGWGQNSKIQPKGWDRFWEIPPQPPSCRKVLLLEVGLKREVSVLAKKGILSGL